jgi:hypothetical protein
MFWNHKSDFPVSAEVLVPMPIRENHNQPVQFFIPSQCDDLDEPDAGIRRNRARDSVDMPPRGYVTLGLMYCCGRRE